ncbi:unannotated protein [freshwater metagenome]|uniref:Unannotated protein n=1 Tax=freshwater metagenome TaxID=449393 RepID=A0A6J7PNW2_9ZZZZ
MHQHRAAAGKEPLDERRADGGGCADTERSRHAIAHLRALPCAAVVQQACGPTLHQTVHIAALADDGQQRRPFATTRRMIGERQRGLRAGQPIDHGCSSIIVE